jgi:cellulose synthase/poly-beta-1,6-N-acetylglucosamine synthase-like glycosyltransferase
MRCNKPGLDIARNSGAAASSCPIVVYTDDDTVLHPTWLQRMVAAFDEPAIWAVTGQVFRRSWRPRRKQSLKKLGAWGKATNAATMVQRLRANPAARLPGVGNRRGRKHGLFAVRSSTGWADLTNAWTSAPPDARAILSIGTGF